MPDYSKDLFFRLQSSHWSVHFLETILKPPEANSGQGRFSPKGPPFIFPLFQGNLQNRTCLKGPPYEFFSALCDFFSKKFLMFQKGPPSNFFSFCNWMYDNTFQRVPPFTFFGTMRLFLKENFFQILHVFFQKNFLRFLSLRYGADFRRSRLVICFPIKVTGIRYPFMTKFVAFRHSIFNFVRNPVISIVLWHDESFWSEAIKTFKYRLCDFLRLDCSRCSSV